MAVNYVSIGSFDFRCSAIASNVWERFKAEFQRQYGSPPSEDISLAEVEYWLEMNEAYQEAREELEYA